MGSEYQTRCKLCFSSPKDLGEGLKAATCLPRCPKDALLDLILEIELAIQFAPNQDLENIPRQLRGLSSIRMKSLPIAPAYGWTHRSRISSRYLPPVRVPLWNTRVTAEGPNPQ
ncbi:hypothetical protein TNCV_5085721 [Trichonephila clavipes]|uniref:Uncharacterized protein n=1 Tax=Trichonephila clavipes TaxID=2585209 RepID=A0A8X6V761_TRICX|nr:hypothetical protein TNCV_5085721 [Trichonephila clavipes]